MDDDGWTDEDATAYAMAHDLAHRWRLRPLGLGPTPAEMLDRLVRETRSLGEAGRSLAAAVDPGIRDGEAGRPRYR